MNKFFFLIIACSLSSSITNAQVFTFEGNDTLYMKREMKFDNFSSDIWLFRDDLQAGRYYQIRKHDCGVDTLRQAEFSEKGVKDGLWIEWSESLCLAIDDESISTQTFSKAEVYKYKEILYQKGSILKSTLYQTHSTLPMRELTYPPNIMDESQWILSRVYKGNYLSYETKIIKDSIPSKTIYYTITYDQNQLKVFSDMHTLDNENEGYITFYQDNNRVLVNGKYVISFDKKLKCTFNQYSFSGTWLYYNESNEHIATLKFKKGRLSKIKHLANGVDESEILNWLNSLN